MHSSAADSASSEPRSGSSSRHGDVAAQLRPFRPLDAVPPDSAKLILSISVGNSRLHWAFHAGQEQNFFPTVFWRSNIPSAESIENIGLESLLPQHIHHHFFGQPSHGQALNKPQQRRKKPESSSLSNAQAMAHLTTQRVPTIYVYVVSTSPEHLRTLVQAFRGIPALVFELKADDLLRLGSIHNDKNHNDNDDSHVVYKGIGVDRVANIAAARLLFPEAKAHLVIDGGTALTYTTVVESSNTGNTSSPIQQKQLAGGIGPGLALNCHALYDYTGDLPFVSYDRLVKTVARCETKKQPLPTLVPASDSDPDTTTDSLLGCILQARALLLCNVVRGFLKVNNIRSTMPPTETAATVQQLPVVVLTGGDSEVYGKLLQPHHSYLCETNESNEQLLQSSLVVADNGDQGDASQAAVPLGKTFRLCNVSHLFPHAVRGLLTEAHRTLDQELAIAETNNGNPGTEWVRQQLLGQRVAVVHPSSSSSSNSSSGNKYGSASRSKKQHALGTILSVIRANSNKLDNDYFSVLYDDVKIPMGDLSVEQIYDGLLLFNEIVQKTKGTDDQRGVRILNKAKDAMEAAELLATKSATVRARLEPQKPQEAEQPTVVRNKRPAVSPASAVPAAKKVTSAVAPASAVPVAKKVKTDAFTGTATMVPTKRSPHSVVEPSVPAADAVPSEPTAVASSALKRPEPAQSASLVGRRVAKEFDEGIFFGTIREFLPKGSVEGSPYDLWSVLYDDDDEEDLDIDDIKDMLVLYESEKKNDDAAK